MRRQTLGLTLLIVLLTLTLLPPLFGYSSQAPAVVGADPPTPGPYDLNATTPLVAYEPYTPANTEGNSSHLGVLVVLVNASDIGECKDGDLTIHTFGVYNNTDNNLIFEDNLQYDSGTGWIVEDYELLSKGLVSGQFYKVRCYFERDTGTEIWTNTTAFSAPFKYNHLLTIAQADYSYYGATSDEIDVSIDHITSSIWGTLTQANASLVFQNADNATDTHTFDSVLTYNVSSTDWEVRALNISILTSGESYKIICSANYSVVPPYHQGIGPLSDAFTFQGPFLRVAKPTIIYVGRDVQTLNITVDWVWHSIFGYLNETEVSLSNFSIWLATGSSAIVLNGTLNYNITGSNWYFAPLNISFYVEQGSLTIGDAYNVTAFFISPARSGRPEVNNTSPFSDWFLIDFDPPSIDRVTINPSSPDDTEWVIVKGEISDDALIDTAILSYYNGSHWINVTMLGLAGQQANFTASIPPFPERQVVEFRIYVNDTQNVWVNTTNQYTVADTLPVISFITHLPLAPTDVDFVTINATVTDGTGIQTVTLQYSYDGIVWLSLDMTSIGDNVYQTILPRYPQQLLRGDFKSVIFFIEATDVFDNIRTSANLAYQVQGTIPTLGPANTLLIIAAIGIIGVVLILLYKVYERY